MELGRTQATQQAYDSVAVDFAERTASRSAMAAEFFERFAQTLAPNATVADLGCGPGHDAARFVQAGHKVIAVDISMGLLALCPAGSLPVQGRIEELPLRPESVDGIWSSASLLHVEVDGLAGTFNEWNRVLRPGGAIGLATSLASSSEANSGWEVVPAGPDRRPEIADGHQRWFVHHEQSALVDAANDVGWLVTSLRVRSSHRDWLQLLVRKQ